MPYVQVPTFVNGRFSRDEANTYIRDNLDALKNPPTAVYNSGGLSADYSTISTSFVAVDSTNMALSIVTTGDGAGNNGDVVIWLCGTVYSSGSIRIYFTIYEDGVALVADDGLLVSEGSGTRPVSFFYLRQNATPANHTYSLYWKVSSGTGILAAHVGTSGRDTIVQFGCRELS